MVSSAFLEVVLLFLIPLIPTLIIYLALSKGNVAKWIQSQDLGPGGKVAIEVGGPAAFFVICVFVLMWQWSEYRKGQIDSLQSIIQKHDLSIDDMDYVAETAASFKKNDLTPKQADAVLSLVSSFVEFMKILNIDSQHLGQFIDHFAESVDRRTKIIGQYCYFYRKTTQADEGRPAIVPDLPPDVTDPSKYWDGYGSVTVLDDEGFIDPKITGVFEGLRNGQFFRVKFESRRLKIDKKGMFYDWIIEDFMGRRVGNGIASLDFNTAEIGVEEGQYIRLTGFYTDFEGRSGSLEYVRMGERYGQTCREVASTLGWEVASTLASGPD